MTSTTLLLVTVLVIMVAAMPMVAILKTFLPAQIEKSANIEQNENRIYVLHSEIHEAQSRLNGLVARRNQRSAEVHRVETDVRKAEKAIRDLENQPPLFVHEVGEPRANLGRYLVNLTLTRSSDSRSAPLNPIWRCTNVAEVWAGSYDEAKQAVEIAFPFKLGYTKTFSKMKPDAPLTGSTPAAGPAAGPAASPATSAATQAPSREAAGGRDSDDWGAAPAADDGFSAGGVVVNAAEPARELRPPAMRAKPDAAAPPPAV